MALQPIHIDISNEISDWKNAAKGKDVRQASVKAFTKLQEQTNKSIDYITEKGSVVDQNVLDVQETRIAAEEAVEYANVISDTSKKYVDNTVGEYKNYADEKLTQTGQKLAEAEASATAAKESSETALGAAETASAQAESAQISAEEAKRYAEQCEGAVGFDGTAQTVSAVDAYELGSDNVQGQLDKLADGIKLPGKNISETNIGTLDTPEEEFPIPETGEKTRTFLGKIKKSMKDWKDFKTGIITLGMLSNQYENSTDKIPTSALVYTLKQTTDQLNSNLGAFKTYTYNTSSPCDDDAMIEQLVTYITDKVQAKAMFIVAGLNLNTYYYTAVGYRSEGGYAAISLNTGINTYVLYVANGAIFYKNKVAMGNVVKDYNNQGLSMFLNQNNGVLTIVCNGSSYDYARI